MFVLWPFFTDMRRRHRHGKPVAAAGADSVLQPITARKLRDSTSYLWPLGVTHTMDREKKYEEWDAPWPLMEFARGEGKTTSRVWPFSARPTTSICEDNWYLWPVYKYNRVTAPPLDRERTRILFFLYSAMNETNTETGAAPPSQRFSAVLHPPAGFQRQRALQVLSVLEPLFPNNKSIERDYCAACMPSGARRRIPGPARPANRCSGTFTGGTPRREQKKSRSCSGFSSINPVRKARAGACVIFRWAAAKTAAAGTAVRPLIAGFYYVSKHR